MMTPEEEKQAGIIFTAGHHDFNRGLNLYVYSKILDHALGEDLVGETFMKTWVYLIRGGGKLIQ
jgi:hypothetical protein